jgi:hypothetical protein
LLSLFFAGDEWIAWTPEGYYAASPGGEKLMGWHLNNGAEKLSTFHPAERFRKVLYRPDVLRRLLRLGSLEAALSSADRERGQETQRTEVAKVLPPEVTFREPASDDQETDSPRVTVTATARPIGGRPIRSLRLLLDGRPYEGPSGVRTFNPNKSGPVDATWTVELTHGTHELVAVAESAVSRGLSRVRKVKYSAAENRPSAARLFVLAVGVSRYRNPSLRLDFAAKDAESLEQELQRLSKPLPYGNVQTIALTDGRATRANILKELSELSKHVTPRDTVVVFFAGHGYRDDEGLLYLIPVDVDLTNVSGTGIESGQLKNLLAKLKGRVMLILDACHSGAAGRNALAAAGELTRELAQEDNGLIVMSASLSKEQALEAKGHGVFTQALLFGLQGKGGRSDDGLVYDHHLHGYVIDFVRKMTQGEQTPTLAKPGDLSPLALSKP